MEMRRRGKDCVLEIKKIRGVRGDDGVMKASAGGSNQHNYQDAGVKMFPLWIVDLFTSSGQTWQGLE